jgi:hypothetical protein
MAVDVFEQDRGIVVSTVNAVETIGNLGSICYNYGAKPLTSGFILDATVALNAGGLGWASGKIREHSHDGVAAIYDRTQPQEGVLEMPGAFALRMVVDEMSGVILHRQSTDGAAQKDAEDLRFRRLPIIMDIGVKPGAKTFGVTKVWDRVVGAAVDQDIRAFAVPGNAAKSVGRLNKQLIQAIGAGEFTLLAACSSPEALRETLDATLGRLHVVVQPGTHRTVPAETSLPPLQYGDAQSIIEDYT